MSAYVNLCRICGRESVAFDDDGSINRDHERCDRVIQEASRPSIIPPGVRTRDWDAIHTAEIDRATPR